MNQAFAAVMATPLPGGAARLGLRCVGQALTSLVFLGPEVAVQSPETVLAERTLAQLERYFQDPERSFDLPLAPAGTVFQRHVWSALQAIPPGHTRRYGELAQLLGSGARAVGGACARNPIPIVIPCHRVLARAGLGGYTSGGEGDGLVIKRWLLGHERARAERGHAAQSGP